MSGPGDQKTMTLDEALAFGIARHQEGQLDLALSIYRQILSFAPGHADALHLSGVVAQGKGNPAESVTLISQAITANPNVADFHVNLGNAYLMLNRFAEAEASLRRGVSLDPQIVEAHYNLGITLQNQGRHDEAAESYRKALAIDPHHTGARNNLGNVQRAQGDFTAAAESFRSQIDAGAGDASSYGNLGAVLQSQEKFDEAAAAFAKALELEPGNDNMAANLAGALYAAGKLDAGASILEDRVKVANPALPVLNNLGMIRRAQNNLAEATELFGQVLARDPSHAGARANLAELKAEQARLVTGHLNLAHALMRQNQPGEAAKSFKDALAVDGHSLDARLGLARALIAQGEGVGAVTVMDEALAASPEDAGLLNARGLVFADLADLGKAEGDYRAALAKLPGFAPAWTNLGIILRRRGQLDEAISAHRTALSHDPGLHQARTNLGAALIAKGDIAGGEAAFAETIAMDPTAADARWNLALARLLQGRFAEAWADFEERWKLSEAQPFRKTLRRPAFGSDSAAGSKIYLYAEQGLGDTLQFLRYVPMLADRGFKLVVEVQADLLPLAKASLARDGVDIVGPQRFPPPHDVHAALMSLPNALGTDLTNIPANIPYLAADPELVAKFEAKLPPRQAGQPRIGLVWAGRPTHANDANRSIGLKPLLPLLATGAQWVSLQVGPAASQAQGTPLIDLTADLSDFAQTAALIACLDHVVAVDTSVAHLAGALGKPVSLLLPFVPDWRWLMDRADSPWYPAFRLFRQKAVGDWSGALSDLADHLKTIG